MKHLVGWSVVAAALLPGIGGALGQSRSLAIINQCEAPVWAVFTPGGAPPQGAALYNSGGWFQEYAKEFEFIPTGFVGSTATDSTIVTLAVAAEKFNFVAGQLIRIAGAGPQGSDVTTTIADASLTTLTLHSAAQTAVSNEPILVPAEMAAPIARKETLTLAVPDEGAPSGNFYFATGCADNGPFGDADHQCTIGASLGSLAGVQTRFEPTFGCIPGTKTCAFNASSPADQYPDCATKPSPKIVRL
jgi:hypothetical protein